MLVWYHSLNRQKWGGGGGGGGVRAPLPPPPPPSPAPLCSMYINLCNHFQTIPQTHVLYIDVLEIMNTSRSARQIFSLREHADQYVREPILAISRQLKNVIRTIPNQEHLIPCSGHIKFAGNYIIIHYADIILFSIHTIVLGMVRETFFTMQSSMELYKTFSYYAPFRNYAGISYTSLHMQIWKKKHSESLKKNQSPAGNPT